MTHLWEGLANVCSQVFQHALGRLVVFEGHSGLDDESEKQGDLLGRDKLEIARAVRSDNCVDERALVGVDVARTECITFRKLYPLKELMLAEEREGEFGCWKEDL